MPSHLNNSPTNNALIVQNDRTILLDVHSSSVNQAREAIAPFTELVKTPEHIHTYQLTALSIWNARSSGISSSSMLEALQTYSKYPIPESIQLDIQELANRYGLTVIERRSSKGSLAAQELTLRVATDSLATLLRNDERIAPLLGGHQTPSEKEFIIEPSKRGLLKQALITIGYPAEDLAGYVAGSPFQIEFKGILRDYQKQGVEAFYQSGSCRGGSGVIVLPCGAGKTIVGMGVMSTISENTLILTNSTTSVRQWHRELLDKTNISPPSIAEYTGETKNTAPITLSTYQMLTYRSNRDSEFTHFHLFHARPWGLIIYDEVHLLPAPVFRATAELQARRRLGLTATLIREDGLETDVFALIGPKRYDVPWKSLEESGFIAAVDCKEIRIEQSAHREMEYAVAPRRQQFRIAAENPKKIEIVQNLIQAEEGKQILIIGEFLSQIEKIAELTKLPLITGSTHQAERERLYQEFRLGNLKGLILSRVGNFALDLPDADVLIQVSGKYGSRQEEAQRLGRILRPKKDGRKAQFYTLVSRRTHEEDYARHRQLFLAEQGYRYQIEFMS